MIYIYTYIHNPPTPLLQGERTREVWKWHGPALGLVHCLGDCIASLSLSVAVGRGLLRAAAVPFFLGFRR